MGYQQLKKCLQACNCGEKDHARVGGIDKLEKGLEERRD